MVVMTETVSLGKSVRHETGCCDGDGTGRDTEDSAKAGVVRLIPSCIQKNTGGFGGVERPEAIPKRTDIHYLVLSGDSRLFHKSITVTLVIVTQKVLIY